jgi:GNAT superfamily N-acetyltransferase
MLEIATVDPTDPDAIELIEALDRDLHDRYPGLPIHGIEAEGFAGAGGVFLVGRLDGRAVVCGAIRPIAPGIMELKRMFVRPEVRGQGLSRAMLAALEAAAVERGHRTIRLETGDCQPEAIALYQSAGYRPIGRYAAYEDDPRSRYFEKTL